MDINKHNYHNIQSVSFKGTFYKSKILKKGLKFAADKGALVIAGSTFAGATIIRPAAILMTPDTTKKDKQYACTKSIESGIINAGLIAAIFAPLSKAMDNISQKPKDYLKPSTIKRLKQSSKTLDQALAYNFIKQTVNISPDLLATLPKSLIISFFIVPITSFIFDRNAKSNKKAENLDKNKPEYKIQNIHNMRSKNLAFNGLSETFSKKIVANIENKKVQDIALKYKDSNFLQHLMNLKDIYATACFAAITELNPKMKKENKKPLIYNTAISTAITIVSSYIVNKAIKKPVAKFINNFKKANKNDKELYKYLSGINVIKPIIILSSLYYIIIPMLSTFWAGKLSNINGKNKTASAK